MFNISRTARWVAGVSLVLAGVMLILGITILSGRLKDYNFLVYWTVCFGLTGLAAVTAALDLLAIKRGSREAQRDLIEETLNEVEEEKKKRHEDG